jgi:hypothetical protein
MVPDNGLFKLVHEELFMLPITNWLIDKYPITGIIHGYFLITLISFDYFYGDICLMI